MKKLGVWVILLLITGTYASKTFASLEMDRTFSLERIGFLRSQDNLDGIFGDYVDQIFSSYFQEKSRFQFQNLEKVSQLLGNSKIPYSKLIQDPEILSQILRSTRTQSLIRTVINQQGTGEDTQYRVQLDWIHSPLKTEKPFILARDTFLIHSAARGTGINPSELEQGFRQALDRLMAKIPFWGHITGKDTKTVTMNLGKNSGITPGDVLVIETIEDVKRHPLLGEVVEWNLSKIGEVRVTEVEDTISFARIEEQTGAIPFAKFQKITKTLKKDLGAIPKERSEDTSPDQADSGEKPKLGYLEGALWAGVTQRDVSGGSGENKKGSGPLFGMKAHAHTWLNRSWFGDFQMGYGISNYTQNGGFTGSGSVFNFRLNGGYQILTPNDFFSSQAWFKFGYNQEKYTLTEDTSQRMGSISFTGPFVGLGGYLPLRNTVSIFLDLGVGLFTSSKESIGTEKEAESAQSVWFGMGFDYRLDQRTYVRGALEVHSGSATFGSASGDTQTNQRRIVFAPALLYYF